MSDTFDGPGWWMASDAKWYPPERHPDPEHRARFSQHVAQLPTAANDQPAPNHAVGGFPAVTAAGHEPDTPPTRSGFIGLAGLPENSTDSTIEAEPPNHEAPIASSLGDAANSPPDEVAETPAPVHEQVNATDPPTNPTWRGFSIAAANPSPAHERPTFDIAPPASVVAPPTHASNTPPSVEPERVVETATPVPQPSTDVEPFRTRPRRSDRLIAAMLFSAGIALIVGSFFDWRITGSASETGWQSGDAYVTVLAGVLGASTAGPMFVGYRHVVPKFLAVIAAVAALVVIALFGLDIFSTRSVDTTAGWGYWTVLCGAGVLGLAGLCVRPDVRFS